MKKYILLIATFLLLAGSISYATPKYKQTSLPIEQRVEDLLNRMTLEGVSIVEGEKELAVTDADGRCTVKVQTGDKITISKKGYQSQVVTIDLTDRQEITLLPEF